MWISLSRFYRGVCYKLKEDNEKNQIINQSEDRGKSPKTHVHDDVSAQMYSARFVIKQFNA